MTLMNQRTFILIVGVMFLAVALLHVCRLAFHWEIQADGHLVPMWISWLGLAISGFLSYSAFKLK